MASQVSICNQALSLVRSSTINSLEEASVQAQTCKIWFDTALDQLLKDTTWPFAHGVKALNQLTNDSIFNWSYIWQYPSDCLYINRLIRNVSEVPEVGSSIIASRVFEGHDDRVRQLPEVKYQLFNISGNRVIATIEPDVRIDYRMRISDMNLLTVNARMALAALLASYLAVPLAGVKDGRILRTDALQLYSAFRGEAAADASNENHIPQQESEFITVRS